MLEEVTTSAKLLQGVGMMCAFAGAAFFAGLPRGRIARLSSPRFWAACVFLLAAVGIHLGLAGLDGFYALGITTVVAPIVVLALAFVRSARDEPDRVQNHT